MFLRDSERSAKPKLSSAKPKIGARLQERCVWWLKETNKVEIVAVGILYKIL